MGPRIWSPGSGPRGGFGRADLVFTGTGEDTGTHYVWEIKPNNANGRPTNGSSAMYPSTTPWHEAWWDLPTSRLGLRITLRRPADVPMLVRAWLRLADVDRAYLVEAGPHPDATYSRLGADMGGGQWRADATEASRAKLEGSYGAYAGGLCGWSMSDIKTTRDGALVHAHGVLVTDDPDYTSADARTVIIDKSDAGVPLEMERAWVDFLRGLVRDYEVLYAEISPDLDERQQELTNYEVRTGRRENYRVMFLEIQDRLRGCGWITWVPSRFLSRLDLEVIRSSGAIYSVEEVAECGLLIQATERAHQFTAASERALEDLLRPVLEPATLPDSGAGR